MKEKLTHNLGLKILAVLFATCLWLISININDPVSPRNYTLTVQLLNQNSMSSAGKYVEVLDDTDMVRVTVRASRSVFTNFSEKNLTATADLNELTADNKIPIDIATIKTEDKIESIKADREFVSVNIENIKKVQLPIDVKVSNVPAAGYILANTTTDQNAVIVSGPESVVSSIASASVEINVDAAVRDVNMLLPVHLYDEEGDEIIDDRLTKSVNEVSTTAVIYQTKEVDLEYTVLGEPAQDYIFTGEITSTPQSITIAGKASVLKNISTIGIEDALNVSGAQSDVDTVVEIKHYLPDGIILADSTFNGTVSVNAGIEKAERKTIEVSSHRIRIVNMPEGFEGTIRGLDTYITVDLIGLKTQLDSIKADEVSGYIDMAAYMTEEEMDEMVTGSYIVPISFELPESVTPQQQLTAHVLVETSGE